jgi:hypothetical protein
MLKYDRALRPFKAWLLAASAMREIVGGTDLPSAIMNSSQECSEEIAKPELTYRAQDVRATARIASTSTFLLSTRRAPDGGGYIWSGPHICRLLQPRLTYRV